MTIVKRYALVPHGPRRLEVRRNVLTHEIAVAFDGRELYRTPEENLHDGIDIALPDESLLHVQVEIGPRGVPFLFLTRNGHPLPGSEGDPVKILWLTVCIFWCFAALQIFFAGAAIYSGHPDGTVYVIGAAGLALVLFATFSWHRSYAATVLGSIVVLVELLIFFGSAMKDNPWWEVWRPIFGFGIAAWLMLRGIDAVREIKAHTLPIRRPPV